MIIPFSIFAMVLGFGLAGWGGLGTGLLCVMLWALVMFTLNALTGNKPADSTVIILFVLSIASPIIAFNYFGLFGALS